jgi:hypothetical protein
MRLSRTKRWRRCRWFGLARSDEIALLIDQLQIMKRFLFLMVAVTTVLSAWADDLDAIQGKWRVKKTGDRGAYTQQLEFKKNQWVFKIFDSEDRAIFMATGEVELKKIAPFNSLRLFKIKAGRSEADLESVEEERNSLYLLDNGFLYLASGFDKPRENEKPSADAYTKAN